jgi:hypothetical protein
MLLRLRHSHISQCSSAFLPKFVHRWLPTVDRVSRYDEATFSKFCATCGCLDEHNEHFLQCPGRKQWQSTLRTDLRKQSEKLGTDPILSEVLLEGYKRGSMVLNSSLVRAAPPSTALSSSNKQRLAGASSSMGDGQRPGDTYKANTSSNVLLLPV